MKFMNQSEYGKHRGVTQQHISRLMRQGYFSGATKTFSGRKLINPEIADQLLDAALEQTKDSPPRKKPAAGKKQDVIKKGGMLDLSTAGAKEEQARYKAALMKLEYEAKSGQLVDKDKVKQTFFDVARLTRDALLNIPDRISAELAGMTDTHVLSERLTSEIMQALEELSNES